MARTDESAAGALQLPPERRGHSAPAQLMARRRALEEAIAAGTWRIEAPHEHVNMGGVRVLRVLPRRAARGVVLHLHGGAFRLGSPEMVAPFAAALAERCSVEVICPAYRLAPEHPFPSGLRDAEAVFAALRTQSETPVFISGDSAGGGLAAGLVKLLVAAKQRVAGLVLVSPWLDLTVESASFTNNAATDPLFSAESAREAAALYLQGTDARHPLASPLFGTVEHFPPTFISIGAEEVLADDGRRFHAALTAAGIAATLHAVVGMQHVAVTRDLTLPGAAETFAAMAQFIDAGLH